MSLTSKQEAFAQAGAKWYVYELIDPRDGEPFYVGKGCKDRIKHHEREARKQLGVCSEKVLRIKDIWSEGKKVVHKFVAYFWSEQAAYDFEAELIADYTIDALSNINKSGGGVYIRGHAMNPDRYAKMMIMANNLFPAFVRWCAHKEIKQNYVEYIHPNGKPVVDACNSWLFPMCWEKIKASKTALDILKPEFMKHGVSLTYGSA